MLHFNKKKEKINLGDPNIVSTVLTDLDGGLYRAEITYLNKNKEQLTIIPKCEWDSKNNTIIVIKENKREKQKEPTVIMRFAEDYEFLSNFYPARVVYEGIEFQSSEAAFQSAKTLDMNIRKEFSTLTASKSKWRGRKLEIRPDWEEVKNEIMYEIVKDKFTRNEILKEKLLSTGEATLIEGNFWHDNYWGDCYCGNKNCQRKGLNTLGKILMRVRNELKEELY